MTNLRDIYGTVREPDVAGKVEPSSLIPGILTGISATNPAAGVGIGAGEYAANLLSGMAAKPASEVMGMSAVAQERGKHLFSGNDPEGDPEGFQKQMQDKMTYQPRSAEGQAFQTSMLNPLNVIGWGMGKIGDFAHDVIDQGEGDDSALGKIANGVREAIEQAPAVIGAKYSGNAALKQRQAMLDVEKSNAGNTVKARQEAQALGLRTPAETGIKKSVSGLARTDRALSEYNAVKGTDVVKKEFGMEVDQPITEEAISALKDKHYQAYRDLIEVATGKYKDNLRIKATPEFTDKIKGYLDDINLKLKEYPKGNMAMRIPKMLFEEVYKKYAHAPRAMLEYIKEMRAEANLLYRGQALTPTNAATAAAKISIANALEGMLEQYMGKLGRPDIMPALRNARMRLAQIHILESVINPATGLIDFPNLFRLSKKTKLTGALKTLADFGGAFPKASARLKGAPEMKTVGIFDAWVAGTSLATGHPGWAMFELGGRMGVPWAATKGYLQNKPSYRARNRARTAGTVGAATAPSYPERNR